MAALSESRGCEETILSALGSFAVVHKSSVTLPTHHRTRSSAEQRRSGHFLGS